MLLDIGAERVSRVPLNPLPTVPVSNTERYEIELERQLQTGNVDSRERNSYSAFERARETLRQAGFDAPNPYASEVTPEQARGEAPLAFGVQGGRDAGLAAYRRAVEQARAQHPDRAASFLTPEEVEKDALDRAAAAYRRSEAVEEVGGGWVGGVAGQMVGLLQDPVTLLTLPLGAGARVGGSAAMNILRTGLIEGGIAGGVQLGIEARATPYRVEAGLPADFGGNILSAAVGGAVIGGGTRALVEGWRAVRGRTPAPDGGVALRENDAATVLERQSRDLAGNPAGTEAAEVHLDALSRASEAVATGRIAPETVPPAAAPRVPVREADPSDVGQATLQFLDDALATGAGRSTRLHLGMVADDFAARVRQATEVDVAGLQHAVQSDEIRHAWNRHGPEGSARDPFPLTRNDIARINEYVTTAERVERERSTHQGLPVLKFFKTLPDGTVVVVEEVRRKRTLMTFKTMYRVGRGGGPGASGSPPVPGAPPTIRPEREPGSAAPNMAPGGDRFNIHTPAGRSIVAEPQVMELRDLIPSHTDDLSLNPAYPHAEGVQPRDRSRDASAAQVQGIASSLEPERLRGSPEAGSGAPIVDAENVVESGNGRVLALRRVYGDPALAERAAAYRAMLAGEGYDIAGMSQPVLVSRRVSALSPDERRGFVREANSGTALTLGAAERARLDADLAGGALDLYRGGDVVSAENAGFVRAFMQGIPDAERGAMLAADGRLSGDGARRVRGAVLARAYGDEMGPLLDRILEGEAEGLRNLAGALQDVAGPWAAMRAAAARGELAPGMDVTADLLSAVRTVALSREKRIPVADLLAQTDLDTPPMSDVGRALLASMYRDPGFRNAAGRASVQERLKGFLDEAMQTKPDPDLFGAPPPRAAEVLEATDPMRGRQRAAAENGERLAEVQAQPQAPDADFLEAQRIAAARDVPVPVDEAGNTRGLRELLDEAQDAIADAAGAAACLIGGAATA